VRFHCQQRGYHVKSRPRPPMMVSYSLLPRDIETASSHQANNNNRPQLFRLYSPVCAPGVNKNKQKGQGPTRRRSDHICSGSHSSTRDDHGGDNEMFAERVLNMKQCLCAFISLFRLFKYAYRNSTPARRGLRSLER